MTACSYKDCGSIQNLTLVGRRWFCPPHLKDSSFGETGGEVCPHCGNFSVHFAYDTETRRVLECGSCALLIPQGEPAPASPLSALTPSSHA